MVRKLRQLLLATFFQRSYLIAENRGGFEVEEFDGVVHLTRFFFDDFFRVFCVEFFVDCEEGVDRLHVRRAELFGVVFYFFFDALRGDAVLCIVRDLDGAAAIGLIYRLVK